MKYTLKRALALLIALLLAMPTFAFAEEPSGEIITLEDVLAGDGGGRPFLISNRRSRSWKTRLWNCRSSTSTCPWMD